MRVKTLQIVWHAKEPVYSGAKFRVSLELCRGVLCTSFLCDAGHELRVSNAVGSQTAMLPFATCCC